MNQARDKKLNKWRGLSWVVALVLVWLQVGVSGFAAVCSASVPTSRPMTVASIASALPGITADHANCFCMMCKGKKKKSCCCAPKAGAARPGCVLTERCDGAASPDTLAAGSPLPLTVLPALAARPSPPAHTERACLIFTSFSRPALGRTPTPPDAPPRNLS